MRPVSASFFISLDGVVEAPEKWHLPYFTDEMGATIGQAMAESDALLIGRRTYDEWVSYWPNQDESQNPMAARMNGVQKYVASHSLESADWQNTTVLSGNLRDEVTKLKEQPGQTIAINGSATLVRSLIRDGLIDELRLMVHPVLLGSGARLFEGADESAPLELVESKSYSNGVLDLTYRPAAAS